MALTNFTSQLGTLSTQNWLATVSPLQPHHVSAVNNLLYGPAGHQETNEQPEYYKNNPYSLPQQNQQQNQQYNYNNRSPKTNNNYLPPPPTPTRQNHNHHQQQQQQSGSFSFSSRDSRINQQQQQFNHNSEQQLTNEYLPAILPSSANNKKSDNYDHNIGTIRNRIKTDQQQSQIPNRYYTTQPVTTITPQTSDNDNSNNYDQRSYQKVTTVTDNNDNNNYDNQNYRDTQTKTLNPINSNTGSNIDSNNDDGRQIYPGLPPDFKRVSVGQGSRTQVHAILDYDVEEGDDEYYDNDNEQGGDRDDNTTKQQTVTPIQGPIFLKNGTVPVVPLFSYPTINNGTFVQIPIWWTALSVALGLDIRGDVIRGVPCIKRYHQLFCPTAGNSYPIDKIERFIDDNKALMRRMYGDFEVPNEYGSSNKPNQRRRRYIDDPDLFIPPGGFPPPGESFTEHGDTYFGKLRQKRQNSNDKNKNKQSSFNRGNGPKIKNTPNLTDSSTGRVDACESKIEIVTPYWASNSAGKIRAIVNTQHFEQAIHQEICTKVQTSRCGNDCGCEQKYKWHRLLAYDPDNDCKGIFMDWFLFPSCCVCRCNP